jgi:hypothetical protein
MLIFIPVGLRGFSLGRFFVFIPIGLRELSLALGGDLIFIFPVRLRVVFYLDLSGLFMFTPVGLMFLGLRVKLFELVPRFLLMFLEVNAICYLI